MLQDKRPSPGSACQHPDWSISTQTVLPQLFSSNNRVFLFPKEFSQQSYHNSSSSHCQIHFLKATKNEEERLWRNVSAQKRSFHCRAWRGDQAVVGIKETPILWEEPCSPWQEHLPCHPPGSVIHCSNGTYFPRSCAPGRAVRSGIWPQEQKTSMGCSPVVLTLMQVHLYIAFCNKYFLLQREFSTPKITAITQGAEEPIYKI